MDILTIGGVTLPAPNEYKVQLNDLDSSDTGRTEDGVMMRNRVREGIAKISASWAAVSTADCARILHAVKSTPPGAEAMSMMVTSGLIRRISASRMTGAGMVLNIK
mgnify:CR=1 FL=1